MNFTDESGPQNSISNWQWDFENDGMIDSDEQNPIFVYDESGVYSVSLTVSNNAERTILTKIKENYITVKPVWQVNPSESIFSGSIWGTIYLCFELVDHTDGILGCFAFVRVCSRLKLEGAIRLHQITARQEGGINEGAKMRRCEGAI